MNHSLRAILTKHNVPYIINEEGEVFSIDEDEECVCLSDFDANQLADWLGY